MGALLLGIAIVACLELAAVVRRELLKDQITQLRSLTGRPGRLAQSLRTRPDGRPKKTYGEVLAMCVCGWCMDGYGKPHSCEAPMHCDCDVTEQHRGAPPPGPVAPATNGGR